MDKAIMLPLMAGVAVAVAAGPLGAFIVWRRVAFFGGALGHSALFGVWLGLILDISLTIGVFAVCAVVALMLAVLNRRSDLAADTLLFVLAHGALAAGLVAMAFLTGSTLDPEAYLFGNIMTTATSDLAIIIAASAVAIVVLLAIWRPLLSLTVDEELARIEGVRTTWINALFMILVALVVAAAMKIVGVLLVASLLVIPAAAARPWSRSPEQMALLAVVIGVLSVFAGLAGAMATAAPAGPAIVVAAVILFIAGSLVPTFRPSR